MVHLAVCHHYCWAREHSYPGAPDDANVVMLRKKLTGFDAAIFGDNHKGFLSEKMGVPVLNCGGFMRRRTDEVNYSPQVGLLLRSGKIRIQKLDISADVLEIPIDIAAEENSDILDFIGDLNEACELGLDFKEEVERFIENSHDLKAGTARLIRKVLDDGIEA